MLSTTQYTTKAPVTKHAPSAAGDVSGERTSLVRGTAAQPRDGKVEPCQTYRRLAKQFEQDILWGQPEQANRLHVEIEALSHKVTAEAPGLALEIAADEQLRHLLRLMADNWYEQAVTFARKARQELRAHYDTSRPYFQVVAALVDVYYGQALIYTSRYEPAREILSQAIAKIGSVDIDGGLDDLTDWRRRLAIGRAHNNLGYIDRMKRRHYKRALQELQQALPYLREVDLLEEYANTLDNMGGVYTMLYNRNRAESLLHEALTIRRALRREARIALSLDSCSRFHLRFADPHTALLMAQQELDISTKLKPRRPAGLAHISLGRSLRRLGTLATTYSSDECLRYLDQAIQHLTEAMHIFATDVDEPVRLIEIYNELGCAYRDRAALRRRDGAMAARPDPDVRWAITYLENAIRAAQDTHRVMYVDSCHDLAQTCLRDGDLHNASLWLDRARAAIPDGYKLSRRQAAPDLAGQDYVEEWWCQMGKIELLCGHFALERPQPSFQQAYAEAIAHYAFAMAQFRSYSDQVITSRRILPQIYSQVRHGRVDNVQYALDQVLPDVEHKTGVALPELRELLEQALELAVP